MKSTLNTQSVTTEQINRVSPIIEHSTQSLFFAVDDETGKELIIDGKIVDRKVRWNSDTMQFTCSCGEVDCEHVFWTIAFVRENGLSDYFNVIEVVDRKERTEALEGYTGGLITTVTFKVEDPTELISPLPVVANDGRYHCVCDSFNEKGTCDHTRVAQGFEEQFHAEMAAHARYISESVEAEEIAESEIANS